MKILSKQKRVRRKRRQRYPDCTPQWMFCEVLGSVVLFAGLAILIILMMFL